MKGGLITKIKGSRMQIEASRSMPITKILNAQRLVLAYIDQCRTVEAIKFLARTSNWEQKLKHRKALALLFIVVGIYSFNVSIHKVFTFRRFKFIMILSPILTV